MRVPTALLAGLALASALPPATATATAAATAAQVTIYRCTDAKGRLTLRDTPCRDGEQQQIRSMLRPRDSTAPAVAPAPPPPPPAPAAATRIVVVSPPQPMYECITPDGDRYTSDTSQGHPRWVPLWTLGYPGFRPRGWRGESGSIDIDSGNVRIHGDATTLSSNARRPVGYAAAGTWIRDTCHALPPQEVCARLIDRRDEIRRRFFNAMPSERDTLRVEERGINARLDNDCGGH